MSAFALTITHRAGRQNNVFDQSSPSGMQGATSAAPSAAYAKSTSRRPILRKGIKFDINGPHLFKDAFRASSANTLSCPGRLMI
jgi:hypothetical protein